MDYLFQITLILLTYFIHLSDKYENENLLSSFIAEISLLRRVAYRLDPPFSVEIQPDRAMKSTMSPLFDTSIIVMVRVELLSLSNRPCRKDS
mmetsp:Transcript_20207/g.30410  ORF Transcript_20207/g.30410 Transcript_20207/m.30410 type:complete len:92 (-) Transcript_20207:96-371(-)